MSINKYYEHNFISSKRWVSLLLIRNFLSCCFSHGLPSSFVMMFSSLLEASSYTLVVAYISHLSVPRWITIWPSPIFQSIQQPIVEWFLAKISCSISWAFISMMSTCRGRSFHTWKSKAFRSVKIFPATEAYRPSWTLILMRCCSILRTFRCCFFERPHALLSWYTIRTIVSSRYHRYEITLAIRSWKSLMRTHGLMNCECWVDFYRF